MLQVNLPLYRTTQRLGLEDLKKLLVVLPPLSPVPTYLDFMPALMGFDLYQMDLKPDEGMQEKALELRLSFVPVVRLGTKCFLGLYLSVAKTKFSLVTVQALSAKRLEFY
jgi:hypothetical protein